jgi:hypothetical protein
VARSVADTLTSLASDLESADSAPTRPQRDLLAHELDRLDAVETATNEGPRD